MKKVLKEKLRYAEESHRNGIIYLDDSIDIGAEVNHQIIATIVENLNILMEAEEYEAHKSDKEKLLQEIVLSSFVKDDLIYSFSDDFKMNIIKRFIDLDDPALIGGTYCFINNYGNLYKKVLIQIKEGKFENILFFIHVLTY